MQEPRLTDGDINWGNIRNYTLFPLVTAYLADN